MMGDKMMRLDKKVCQKCAIPRDSTAEAAEKRGDYKVIYGGTRSNRRDAMSAEKRQMANVTDHIFPTTGLRILAR